MIVSNANLYKFHRIASKFFGQFMTARKAIKIFEWSMRSIIMIDRMDKIKSFKQKAAPWNFFDIKIEKIPMLDNKIYQKITNINMARFILINLNILKLYLDYSTHKMGYFLLITTAPTAVAYFVAENKFFESKAVINKYKNIDLKNSNINETLHDKHIINEIALQNPLIEAVWCCAPEFWFKAVVETAIVNPSIPRYTLNLAASIAFTCFSFGKYELLQLEAMNLLKIFEQEANFQDVALVDTTDHPQSASQTAGEYEQKSGDSLIYYTDEL